MRESLTPYRFGGFKCVRYEVDVPGKRNELEPGRWNHGGREVALRDGFHKPGHTTPPHFDPRGSREECIRFPVVDSPDFPIWAECFCLYIHDVFLKR